MGMMTSRLGAYSSKFMMSTQGYIHFAEDMRRQQAYAAGAQQLATMSQLTATGGVGGGASGGGGPVPGVGWFRFGQTITAFAPFAILIGGAASGIAYAMKAEQYVMFVSLLVTMFFAMFFILFHTQATMSGTLGGRNFWIALGSAALGSYLIAFLLYKGPAAKQAVVMVQQQPNQANQNLRPVFQPL